ncbi:TatD family hydrolase [Thermaerobacter subterraneus]|uniref:Hydrolase, TatD family n=1 Tax=Thermaerobacter subterraneus DSM 13965 TaxID=867903 RepID=K6P0V5_9FIRM|nr:TatD family hydrolase [Thermaerobacter subterraneus]EKP94735.1 hydrolase, TatD family [Thermaerobacter subterraneus DSM 13965]
MRPGAGAQATGLGPLALVDTHCHLDFPDFDRDRDQVVAAARAAGVVAMITIGIDLESSRRAVALAEGYQDVYAAVGIHPYSAGECTAAALAELRRLAAHPRVVAIGEIGLDYHRGRAGEAQQKKAFLAQLELAADLGLPVIIHQRDAVDDLWDLLAAPGRPQVEGVLHCFSAGPDWAARWAAAGWFIGLDGPVTFKNGEDARATARAVPLERLLVETDAPFLAPHPHRGRRNQPAWVRLVAERIAAERGLPLDRLAAQTTANAARLFRLALPPVAPSGPPRGEEAGRPAGGEGL